MKPIDTGRETSRGTSPDVGREAKLDSKPPTPGSERAKDVSIATPVSKTDGPPTTQLVIPDLRDGGVPTSVTSVTHQAGPSDILSVQQSPAESMFEQLERLMADSGYRPPADLPSDPGLSPFGYLMPNDPAGRITAISPDQGALTLADRAAFDQLATRDNVPGAPGVREVKFLIADADTDDPKLYFINTNTIPYHFYFARDVLGVQLDNREFNSQAYFTDHRKFIAGTLVAYDNVETEDGETGVYGLEFWPTDPVGVEHVVTAKKLIDESMSFAGKKLRYHPAGETQLDRYEREKAEYDAAGIDPVTTEELLGNATFTPLNLGVSYGRLRVYSSSDPIPPTARDVVIFENTPNDLSHVAGVITEEPQTPLSHVNLKAKQNKTPNSFLKDASQRDDIRDLVGEWVRYEVTADGVSVVAATQAEVDEHFEAMRPTVETVLEPNLGELRLRGLQDLRHANADAFGAKAANVAELGHLLGLGAVPDGFAIPFSAYDRFMRDSGLYDEALAMISDADFKSDPAVRSERLEDFRRRMRRMDVDPALSNELQAAYDAFVFDAIESHAFYARLRDVLASDGKDAALGAIRESMHFDNADDPDEAMQNWLEGAYRTMQSADFDSDPARGLRDLLFDISANEAVMRDGPRLVPSMRARSSTNNEDMEGFNGAGLYDSYTHHPDEGRFDRTVKQVWSSLWNFRAFEERDFFRIDHFSAAMGILVHPNFADEQANGVAVTKNIYDPNWEGYYINAQVGEELVTNPEGGLIPDELLVAAVGENLEWETQYIRHSNATEDGQHVLNAEQVAELTEMMQKIQRHFRMLYGRFGDRSFAMDIEFKIDVDGRLMVKQARPWID